MTERLDFRGVSKGVFEGYFKSLFKEDLEVDSKEDIKGDLGTGSDRTRKGWCPRLYLV